MDTIYTVFESLEIDKRFFIQFALVTILYFILRNLFLEKLQEVLDLREDNTTKMESGADDKLSEADKIAKQYKDKIEDARQEAFKIISKRKDEVVSREMKNLKEHEASLDNDLNSKLDTFKDELNVKKQDVMKQAQNLSEELVTKIVH